MKTLHKTIKKKWFDMIVSGEKKHEYLEIKSYWINRLIKSIEVENPFRDYPALYYLLENAPQELIFEFKDFQTVTCRNGYNQTSPLVVWKHEKITIGEGKPEWGAEPGKKYFILHIGEIISVS